ncbi:hypothetical protein ASPWEDRAFT_42830 [Aspergillus wentii DTO 134E9]|uniref:PH domain-containing protein n=1 Tax=Aspergillus wentii DTO 134E9 TaxID=1073089 RepID=A0A1L9RCZ9_ASPWE|nr:uncharacterized protein ASPWEDRAFT_42830 [Aspergillus wentii DTO 134E9]KAI9933075.1 hypothetical protein MW887_007546 [Aspergillus wentii]OJJ32800.1 hypothetical protein ASPWEDRAFT_42830 [Aspergillus wentii DTO 134E9]
MESQSQSHEPVGIDSQTQAPVKFSRYRSVRKAAKKLQQLDTSAPSVPVPPVTSPQALQNSPGPGSITGPSPTISKSMSRYRRNRAPTATSSPASPTQSPLPASVEQSLAREGYPSPQQESMAGKAAASGSPRKAANAEPKGGRFYSGDVGKAAPTEDDEATREKHRRSAMDRLTGGSKMSKAVITSRKATMRERSPRVILDDRNPLPAEDRPSRRSSKNESKRISLKDRIKMSRSSPKNEEPTQKPVEPPTGPSIIRMDAPLSAVNAGERTVLVHYKRSSLNLPVTPATSVQDLLFLASSYLAGGIDPQTFIAIESFSQLDLERPLRRYEYIRDVMNSWMHDEENSLIIVPPASFDAMNQLDIQSISAESPVDVTFHIYYSQRPKKWDKRFVTLRADGQVTVSKKPNGQEQTNACHLTDFDIYSPTAAALSNNIKPPRKICYAVKSQQKSTMFVSTENYAHFFCTNDKVTADGFYRAVQTWRSWYLVTRLGAGKEDSPVESDRVSSDSNTYQPVPIKPLVDLNASDFSNSEPVSPISREQSKSSRAKELFARKKSTREHAPPPSAYPKSLSINTNVAGSGAPVNDETPFEPTSLLGRTYSMRRRAMQERDEEEKRANEPLTPQGLVRGISSRRQFSGPSSQPHSRSNTMTSAQPPDMGGTVSRSQSINKHQPLVDLTPKYQEPPQHARKGRGVAVEPGMPLIDAATGPDLAPNSIAIPPSTTWRRPSVSEAPPIPQRSRQRSNTARSVNNAPPSPVSPDAIPLPDGPFVPNSLLSRSTKATTIQGQPTGHGIATGDRNAMKPMLDLSPVSPFAEGSLLRNL